MMHPRIKFDNPSCYSTKVLLRTRSGQGFTIIMVKGQSQGHSDLNLVRDTSPSRDASTYQV